MDKLTAIKIKYENGTYSDEIPISVLSKNVEWDNTHTLVDILGSINVDATGTLQDQISQLFNKKVSSSDMQAYVTNSMPAYITSWLNTNVNPVGSAVVVDSSLTVSGAAADAKVVGDKTADLDDLKSAISEIQLDVVGKKNGSATVASTWSRKQILSDVPLAAGHHYKITFSVAEALEYTVYVYLSNSENEVLTSGQIKIGQTSQTLTYNPEADSEGNITSFDVGVSTSTTVNVKVTDEDAELKTLQKTVEQKTGDIANIESYADDVDERQKYNSSRVDTLTGEIAIYENMFAIGNVGITANGWDYHYPYWTEDDKKRGVVVKEGQTLLLNKGDIVSLSSYSGNRMYIGWKLPNDEYGYSGWKQVDFVCPVDSEYCILIANTPDRVQTNKHDLLDLLKITRYSKLTQLSNNSNIKCINHRGFNTLAPENTIPAFKLSKEYGFDYVETDVSFTADGTPVLMHDNTVDRTTDGTGNIWELTDVQVEALDAGSWFSSEYAGTKVPTLEEFMTFCKKAGLKPYLEIKVSANFTPTNANIQTMVDIVKKTGMIEATTFICVNINPLIDTLALLPKCRGGIISGSNSVGYNIDYVTKNNHYNLFVDTNSITTKELEDCVSNEVPLEWWIGTDSDMNWANLPTYITGLTSNAKTLYEYWYNQVMNT